MCARDCSGLNDGCDIIRCLKCGLDRFCLRHVLDFLQIEICSLTHHSLICLVHTGMGNQDWANRFTREPPNDFRPEAPVNEEVDKQDVRNICFFEFNNDLSDRKE